MTQDEIIEMAMEKAEFVSHGKPSEEESELFVCTDKDIVRFAKLVAEKERTWVGLTDEEIDKILRVYEQSYGWIRFAKDIEAKLKEKNNG
jgi:hypothetical protein